METEARIIYDSFKDCGDLSVFIPKPTGDWEKDKKAFIARYKEHKKLMEDLGIDL